MSYPLTFPDADPRFTGPLIDDVAKVLVAHGYPPAFDDDTVFAGLRTALTRFLYGPEFKTGDRVSWAYDGTIWTGTIDAVADTGNGQLLARIDRDPQPGLAIRKTRVVKCSDLTQIPKGGA